MNPNQKRSRRVKKKVRFWTRERALNALPYVRGVLRSLRDHKLQVRALRRRAKRLADLPGCPTRDALIAREEALREAQQAQTSYEEAWRELQVLNLKCPDALQGVVYFPIVHDNLLAWLIFDLHEEEPLQTWRYRDDPDGVSRPWSELDEEAQSSGPPRKKPR